MLYEVHIKGIRPIIQNNGNAVDPNLPANQEKSEIGKRRTKGTVEHERMRLLECEMSLWLIPGTETPTIPPTAIRAAIETAARKSKEGPLVREGLVVSEVLGFDYDTERYGTTLADLSIKTQFRTAVVIQRSRVIKARARFDLDWGLRFVLDCDDELIERERHLEKWLDIAGRRIGLGDWRPEKSGDHGRFEAVSITARQD